MSDIVERLRNWRTVHLAWLHLLMEEAADEIERLRLTDEERETLEWAAQMAGNNVYFKECDALRALLARLK